MNFSIIIFFCTFFLTSCDEVSNKATDNCQKGIQRAKLQIAGNNYSVYMPYMENHLTGYAEEIFLIYYGKTVDILNSLELLCGVKDSFGICFENTMDSAIRAIDPKIYSRVANGADSLYKLYPARYHGDFPSVISFPGGDTALHGWIARTIHYPLSARRDAVEGMVVLRMEIDTSGWITKATVIKGVRNDLDSAAISAVLQLPAFNPLYKRGKKIPGEIMLPIKFRLE